MREDGADVSHQCCYYGNIIHISNIHNTENLSPLETISLICLRGLLLKFINNFGIGRVVLSSQQLCHLKLAASLSHSPLES